MSVVGINIKKIRSIKGLNQTEFANLFGLTRANIGSYEELRAEPKIDIIIKIATYYKLPIDKLVRKELTVNEISHFDVFDKLPIPIKPTLKSGTAFITQDKLESYPKNKTNAVYLAGLSTIDFPFGSVNKAKLLLFNEGNDLFVNSEGFLHGDILFLEEVVSFEETITGVVIDESHIYKGIVSFLDQTCSIRPLNLNAAKKNIRITNKVAVWKIVGKYTSQVATNHLLVDRIENLERQLNRYDTN